MTLLQNIDKCPIALHDSAMLIALTDLWDQIKQVTPDWLEPFVLLIGGILGAMILHALLYSIARRLSEKTKTDVDVLLVKNTRRAARAVMVMLVAHWLVPTTGLVEPTLGYVRQVTTIALILSITWLAIRALGVIDDMILTRHPINVRDNLKARQIHTQTRVLSRTLMIIVGSVGIAAVLMTFPRVRQFGESLLASAGIAGVIIGLAARATIANLIAGVQLALTQPIRIDDAVVIEGEWGWIEEIRSTYVVVKIWDERRLVVPLNDFIEKPFQNWTRKTADLIGSVFIHADYRLPVDRVRDELKKIAEACEEFDGRVCVLQVTNAGPTTIELRALVSAGDSPSCWDLRCKVREKLIAYLQAEFPECLPRVRAEIEKGDGISASYAADAPIDVTDPTLRRSV